jgi:acetyl esterase/lipase
MATVQVPRRSRFRWFWRLISALIVLALAAFIAFKASPWPSVLAIRWVFDRGGQQSAAALEKHVPRGVSSTLDLHYDPADPHAYLDVHRPATLAASSRLPTIVWIHGGGFVAGTKDEIANYLRILAARGYVVVGVDYSLAPGARYPAPVRQVNRALAYLSENAPGLNIDRDRMVLAGDSAGAQIAAQVANLVTSEAYAGALGIRPALRRAQLRGAALFCGPFDLALVDRERPSWFLSTVLWSYSGRKDFWNVPQFDKFSVAQHLTEDFPPTFISVGNDDPLEPHSFRMAEALEGKGVRVDRFFFPDDHAPPLPHEYQLNLDGRDGQEALRRLEAFLSDVLKQPSRP